MIKKFLLAVLSFYQNYISGLLPKSCYFEPSCSQYSREVILKEGVFLGLLKSFLRLLRCQGFSKIVFRKNSS
ncbi:MAG: membrane protein insertion efficiency factor YidD [Candidatus Omnitrophica bacterium]|nr:membrane protein insertion efficiency factor YidD [Candidatus Omnitrophota bacterium]MCM8799148.1 membrane protein insertion efficiency factor YidD [Candidatus Omnitrophota bacterium]